MCWDAEQEKLIVSSGQSNNQQWRMNDEYMLIYNKIQEFIERENQDSNNQGNNQGNNQDEVKLTDKQKAVLAYCADAPRTAKEIFAHLGVSVQSKNYNAYINQLIEAGKLSYTIQGNKRAKGQQYVTVHSDE